MAAIDPGIRNTEQVDAASPFDLGEILALNPSVNSLALPAGTKLRIG